jgi:hypothetical protein
MTTDLIVAIIALVSQSLLWIWANILFKQQNRIMREQLEHDIGRPANLLTSVFWPMIAMGAFALLSWAAVGTWIYIRHISANVTPSNIEEHLRPWLDQFHFSVAKEEDPSAYFRLEVQLPDKAGLTIERIKGRDQYLTLGAYASLTPELVDRFNKLNKNDQEKIGSALALDIILAGRFQCDENLPRPMLVVKQIPITNELTENVLLTSIQDIYDGLVLVRDSFILNLQQTENASITNKSSPKELRR